MINTLRIANLQASYTVFVEHILLIILCNLLELKLITRKLYSRIVVLFHLHSELYSFWIYGLFVIPSE